MQDKHPKRLLAPTAIVSSHVPSMFSRQYTGLDLILHSFGQLLSQFHVNPLVNTRNPSKNIDSDDLSIHEQAQSAALMRVNHAGEVCAQGLYLGQAFFCKDPNLKKQFLSAAQEEADHLDWCQERLFALNSRRSYLSAFWYTASLAIGILVSTRKDTFSLGFLEETERQVMRHLEGHLERLPQKDIISRAILERMYQEETEHATWAKTAGASTLPWPVPTCMQWTAKIMTTIASTL